MCHGRGATAYEAAALSGRRCPADPARVLDEPGLPDGLYPRLKTYLCKIVQGEAKPGYEPEIEAAQKYAIVDIRWFDLRDPSTWDDRMRDDPFTFPLVQRIRAVLGYPMNNSNDTGTIDSLEKAA